MKKSIMEVQKLSTPVTTEEVRQGMSIKLVLWTSAQNVELFRQLFPDEGEGQKTLLKGQ
jgi:hypothetical protein